MSDDLEKRIEGIDSYLDKFLYPGRIFSNHCGYFEIIQKMPSKGSESDIYLVRSRTPTYSRDMEKIVLPGTAFVLKVNRPKSRTDISTSLDELKKHISKFESEIIGITPEDKEEIDYGGSVINEECVHYLDPDELHQHQGYNNYKYSMWLNRNWPDLFPAAFGEPQFFLRTNKLFNKVFNSRENPHIYLNEKRPGLGGYDYPNFPSSIFEYIGPTLDTALFDLGDEEKIKTINSLFQSVYALQKFGVIHKDLSLSNILMGKNNPKIIDFSMVQQITAPYVFGKDDIASCFSSSEEYPFNLAELFIGNRLFRAPEIYKGFLSPKNDVWSIGLVAFSVFTGEHLIPIIDSNHKVLPATDISKEDKTLFAESMQKQSRGNYSKLRKIIKERIMDNDRIPYEYKQAILYCAEPIPDKRRNVIYTLDYLGITAPKPEVERGHKHDNKLVFEDNSAHCSGCIFNFVDKWGQRAYNAVQKTFGGIPKEIIWKDGMTIDQAQKQIEKYSKGDKR